MRTQEISTLIVAILALLGAVGTAYVSVATKTTFADVEHIIELKTTDKLDEIRRLVEKVDKRLDRIEHKE